MADALDDYRRKRDFRNTPEPDPAPPRPRRDDVFVVHRHEARQLHYDLRLEHAGVLKSWAVPRGFSYDPADKRLAVRTEDHPLEYEHFHGRIPKGQYGAGTMQIWDRGRYELVATPTWEEAMARGELKFRLFGRRLRGEWHLVRTQQSANSWLLFKSKDVYSGPARDSALGVDLDAAATGAVPIDLPPMRWSTSRDLPSGPDWVHEVELPGRRTLAHKRGDAIAMPGLPALPAALAAALRGLRCHEAVLDGIAVAVDPAGRPTPDGLEAALAGGSEALVYYAFDLLQWEDYDLRPLPLLDRKRALRALLPATGRALFVDHVAGDGASLLAAIAAAGLPAAIAKRAGSAYASGPGADWVRVPCVGTAGARATVRDRGAAPTPALPFRPTNLSKVYWPADGYTKGDLLAYYHAVAEALLPHLRDRPLHLNRFPDGIDGKSFYQREAKDGTPAWVRTAGIEHDGAIVPHHVVDDLPTLLHVANLGSIDLHPWLSRLGSLDEPDFAVLDLDPKQAPFAHVVRIARAAGRLLRGIGLRPLLKTSGKNGMHVFVPLQRGFTYDHARMFCEAIARLLVRELPDIATVERLPDRREGRVYLDFLQNRRSQTIVPPYSVRPVPGASVSAPLAWDELEDAALSPRLFTIRTMPARLARTGDLFRKALDDPQDLLPAIGALEEALRGG